MEHGAILSGVHVKLNFCQIPFMNVLLQPSLYTGLTHKNKVITCLPIQNVLFTHRHNESKFESYINSNKKNNLFTVCQFTVAQSLFFQHLIRVFEFVVFSISKD